MTPLAGATQNYRGAHRPENEVARRPPRQIPGKAYCNLRTRTAPSPCLRERDDRAVRWCNSYCWLSIDGLGLSEFRCPARLDQPPRHRAFL